MKKAVWFGVILSMVVLSVFFYLIGQGSLAGRVKKEAGLRALNIIERKESWEDQLSLIETELYHSQDWFDSIEILSTWLYQNTRVGASDLYIARTVAQDLSGWIDTISAHDAKWFYELNNSDSVVSFCGEHCDFASRLYQHFGFLSYNLSLRQNPSQAQSTDGHMINIVQNPHNLQWYPVDHFFGLRWRYEGQPLAMETFYRLSKEQLRLVDVETFGAYKIYLQQSPVDVVYNNCYLPIEVALVEPANHKNYYRIVAPFTLRKTFPLYQPLFDSIAASYQQPPHVDWIDLARRLPLYSARLYSPIYPQQQSAADALLKFWKQQ